MVAVDMLGKSNLELPLRILKRSQFVESALKKQQEALSVRVSAKAAVDGAATGLPHGHCRFEMTPITEEEVAPIFGIIIIILRLFFYCKPKCDVAFCPRDTPCS